MATENPYPFDTPERHAWHRGYEGLIYMGTDPAMTAIYDKARQQAIDDAVRGGVNTSLDKRVIDGHVYYVLLVNGHDVFKSMMPAVVEKLKESLDAALVSR